MKNISAQDFNIPGIEIKDFNLSYNNIPVFSHFDLYCPAKEWTCLLGVSGIGKSTLLHAIAGLIPTDQSQENSTITATDGLALDGRIAYLSQQNTLLPWCTVLKNVLSGFRLRNQTIDQTLIQRAHYLLEQARIAHAINYFPHQLSGGMQQRVALVRTMIEDRPVILMDEPFAMLDWSTRYKLQTLAAQLFQGKTVLLVTHDPMEALRLGHNIYVLNGSPPQARKNIKLNNTTPRHPQSAELLTQQAELIQLLTDDI